MSCVPAHLSKNTLRAACVYPQPGSVREDVQEAMGWLCVVAHTCPHWTVSTHHTTTPAPKQLARKEPDIDNPNINPNINQRIKCRSWLLFCDILCCNQFRLQSTHWFQALNSQTKGLMICRLGKNGLLRVCLHDFHMLILLILCISQQNKKRAKKNNLHEQILELYPILLF